MRVGSLRAKAGLAALALAGVVPAVAGTGVAAANPALCGMVVTQNTTLTSDVGPCSSTGIIIGADNIVLDLGGHRVFAFNEIGDEGAGILARNRTGVTIRNGIVEFFDAGVVIEGGSGNLVHAITARNNIGNAFTDYGDGIVLFSSSRNRIFGNVADHNGPYDGIGVVANSDDNVIEGNLVINNTIINSRSHGGSEGTMEDDGIRIESFGPNATPDRNVVRGNRVLNNGLDGIAVFPNARDNQIIGNTVHGNGFLGNVRRGDGIHLFGFARTNLVQGNDVRNNARHGIRIDATPTFPPPNLQNRILANTVLNNGLDPSEFEDGYDLSDGNRFCDGNIWANNRFNTTDPVTGADCYG